ncbi:helix-turn-helix domain-containing protein [Brevibacillus humidisoli]|uniref:MerR family transcriptional regulator n=1 Tax=Brevibacillus humidisoli TaxID=2895522 RepID=UPI001E3C3FD2|nr:MerR family transcriptional regulator [Brevibacillus humidisoli]UFJ41692.1 helix-turn-helix domain-containing protein [Brevibacillus humidisoli]
MSLDVQVWMASKEVAERLGVQVRTLRNWLEMFVPVTERQKNAQGHYMISEQGYLLLKEVKERKDGGNASLLDIKQELIAEGLLSEDKLSLEETAAASAEGAPQADVHHPSLVTAFREVEVAVQDTLCRFQMELAQLSTLQQTQTTILKKIADIEEMQESLRLELRRVTFEMDLMQQRLTKRKHRQDRYQSRFSLNPLRWFGSNERATQ